MTITFTPPTVEVARDRFGRPLITPADGGKAIPYMRVSTLAKVLDSKDALMAWKQRMTAIGIGKRPDLAALAAVTDPDDKVQWKEIVAGAMAAAESDRAANVGTTLHTLTEQFDKGQLESCPPEHMADLTAYEEATKGLTMRAAELFVVNDEVQAAGTFDRLVTLPDGRTVVADLKTGQSEDRYPHGVATQVAIYAHSHLYDAATSSRTGYLPDLGVSTDVGLLIHLPAGKATCRLYLLDLSVGYALARAAVAVKGIYAAKPITEYQP